MRTEIANLLTQYGAVARRDHPTLTGTMDRLLREGELVAVLPGVYVASGCESEFVSRVAAVPLWDRDAVITGTAARLSFWPKLEARSVAVAAGKRRPRARGFEFSSRTIPSEFIVESKGLRHTNPSLTALDLATTSLGGGSIDTVLRSRRATLAQLHSTLAAMRGREGNQRRAQLLLDSRDEPWSHAERTAHVLLRSAGITGWVANFPLVMLGTVYYLDIAFEKLRLAIEIDGRAHHGQREFDADRWRQNDIVLDRWRVLRFSATTIEYRGEIFIRQVERAVDQS